MANPQNALGVVPPEAGHLQGPTTQPTQPGLLQQLNERTERFEAKLDEMSAAASRSLAARAADVFVDERESPNAHLWAKRVIVGTIVVVAVDVLAGRALGYSPLGKAGQGIMAKWNGSPAAPDLLLT